MQTPHTSCFIWYMNFSLFLQQFSFLSNICSLHSVFPSPRVRHPLSDMLMLLIAIGKRTEPSADKKTMLAASHGFLPQCSERCVCRLYRSSWGSHNLLSHRLHRRGPSGLCTNSPLPSKTGGCKGGDKLYRMSSMDVSVCFFFVFFTIRVLHKGACGWWRKHTAARCAFTGFSFFFALCSRLWPQGHRC